MMRLLLLHVCMAWATISTASTIIVKNIAELDKANKEARPGDVIILQDGKWNDVTIALNCKGTITNPIIFKAQSPGGVKITGNSKLQLGGDYIVVSGLHFVNGYAGKDAVISFRINKKELANNCRVTNCVIDGFNNPKRMDENNWVLFYGKNNRLDHSHFTNKKNMGVLLAVVLDDDRSRENFHSIDSNYFGRRIPLASNGGEIIRVGVSQHCQFKSNTIIKDNLFEECDGETEIVSIKSGSNIVSGNIFKESQGSVVLRHGDDNIVEKNIFLGNDKFGTGGVRVINKGQIVRDNIFYKCRGTGFRSPLAIMNGIPNSPAHRYVQVTDATITRNIFFECSPMSLGEGSDTERTLPPSKVLFAENDFHNSRDAIIYKSWDDISGIQFSSNGVTATVKQELPTGFNRSTRYTPRTIMKTLSDWEKRMQKNTGVPWYQKKAQKKALEFSNVKCANAAGIYAQLKNDKPVNITLTGAKYVIETPFVINKPVHFIAPAGKKIYFVTGKISSVFIVAGNGHLTLKNLSIDGRDVQATHLISSDSSGSSDHFNLVVQQTQIQNLSRTRGCESLFFAFKSIISDSIVFVNNTFQNNSVDLFLMNDETDDKGYYNAEKILFRNNKILDHTGQLINIYRGGNDESTLGPLFIFEKNTVANSKSGSTDPLLRLFGVQQSVIRHNSFVDSNTEGLLLLFEDKVRADHQVEGNNFRNSGRVVGNKYVGGGR